MLSLLVGINCGRASHRVKSIVCFRIRSRSFTQGFNDSHRLLSRCPFRAYGSSVCCYSTSIRMPSLSPTMSEGTIVKWHKAEGEAVRPGDILCDIQTDKAVVSFEFEDEGVLARVFRADGSSGSVGDVIAVMADPGEDWRVVAEEAAKSSPAPGSAQKSKTPAAAPSSSSWGSSSPPRRVGPAAQLLLRLHHLDASSLRATGPHGTLLKSDVIAYVKSGPPAAAAATVASALPQAAPVVTLSTPVSGPAVSRPAMSPLEPRTPPGYLDHPVAPGLRDWAVLQTAIKSTVPHAYATVACRPHLPASLKTEASPKGASPIVALAVRALASALSSAINGGGDPVNIGVLLLAAPALPRLIRLPRAQALGLAEISKRLATAEGSADNSSGPLGAIVCDLSVHGAVQFAHLPLHPEAPLLLTVGRQSSSPSSPTVRLGLTADSRRFDHAEAAALLGTLADGIENPLLGLSGGGGFSDKSAAASSTPSASVGIVGSDLLQLGLDD